MPDDEPYRCPFCARPMPLCRHAGVFYLRYPDGRLERRQLDIRGVEIDDDPPKLWSAP